MPIFKFSIVVLISSLIVCCHAGDSFADDPAQEYTLRYRFQPGEVIRFEESLRDDYTIQMSGAQEKPYSYQTSGKSMKILNVAEDGTATAQLQFDWVVFDVEQNGLQEKWDSRTGDEPPATFAGIVPILGRPLMQVKISPSGAIENVNSLIGQAAAPDPNAVLVLQNLPEGPVKIGETWKEDSFIDLQFPDSKLKKQVRLQEQFELKSVEGDIATIRYKKKVLTPVDDPQLQMQLLRRQPEGHYRIDLQNGKLLSLELTQDNMVTNFNNGPSVMKFKQNHTQKLVPNQVAGSDSNTTTN